ncbi:thyroxine 5-deiodinase-like [Haliotis rubra]|uniref:thyroxine 5-deiodinase-like n=1 Tax=Haliotis rubra TaxID=36100 RepID=UPI001EE508C8|nr:thyroxine 5-deiodinase-like [Haliotis rubra]
MGVVRQTVLLWRLLGIILRLWVYLVSTIFKRVFGKHIVVVTTTKVEGATSEDLARDYDRSVLKLSHFKGVFRAAYLDLYKDAFLHHLAPNPRLHSLDGTQIHRLLDFQKQGRPLVVNFGSCT